MASSSGARRQRKLHWGERLGDSVVKPKTAPPTSSFRIIQVATSQWKIVGGPRRARSLTDRNGAERERDDERLQREVRPTTGPSTITTATSSFATRRRTRTCARSNTSAGLAIKRQDELQRRRGHRLGSGRGRLAVADGERLARGGLARGCVCGLSLRPPKVDAESSVLRVGIPPGGDLSSSSGNTNSDDEHATNTTIDCRDLSRLPDCCVRFWGQRFLWRWR